MKFKTSISTSPLWFMGTLTCLTFNSCTKTETILDYGVYTRDIEVSLYENPEQDTVLSSLYSLDSSMEDDPTFSIISQSASGLRIQDGNLIVDDPSVFDYEANPIITGEIEATVGDGSYTSAFTINLKNIIETDEAFVTTWQTTEASETITLYTHADAEEEIYYDFDIDWGDGNIESNVTDDIEHTYTTAGTYTVTITGKEFPGITQEYWPNATKLKTIEAWGSNEWSQMTSAFSGCADLVINATDAPIFADEVSSWGVFYGATNFNSDIGHWDVSNLTALTAMFRDTAFNQDISAWDVSNVTDMTRTFNNTPFNQDISSWSTSNVKSLNNTFYGAREFNQDISAWDVSSVVDMQATFRAALAFNQDISAWNVSGAEIMSNMFRGANAFNQDISGWDVSNVLNMSEMFRGDLTTFNQDLSAWDVSNVTSMAYMFTNSPVFNQDLSAWDTSSVISIQGMFQNAKAFNGVVNTWDISNVTSLSTMFEGSPFNQDISSWDVSNVTDMSYMFKNATAFNQDIGSWDTGNVTRFPGMFEKASVFNQDISNWNTSNVTALPWMFKNASAFDQDLSSWDVGNVTSCTDFSKNVSGSNFVAPALSGC